MKIQILGTGCAKCRALTAKAEEAAAKLGLDYELEKVEGLDEILAMGVMATPALVVDGEVRLSGSVPPVWKLEKLLAPR